MYTDIEQAPEATPDMSVEEFYRTTSLKGKVAMRERRLAGEAMHKAPLGYRNARDAEGRSFIVPDPDVLPLVEEARRMRAEGRSLRSILDELTPKGLVNRRGRRLSPSSLICVLAPSQD